MGNTSMLRHRVFAPKQLHNVLKYLGVELFSSKRTSEEIPCVSNTLISVGKSHLHRSKMSVVCCQAVDNVLRIADLRTEACVKSVPVDEEDARFDMPISLLVGTPKVQHLLWARKQPSR